MTDPVVIVKGHNLPTHNDARSMSSHDPANVAVGVCSCCGRTHLLDRETGRCIGEPVRQSDGTTYCGRAARRLTRRTGRSAP